MVSIVTLELQGLRTVIYPVTDLSASTSWWERALGVAPYFAEPFYVGFNVAGYELGLLPDPDASQGPLVYWGVDDVQEAMNAALDLGAREHTPATSVGEGIVTGTVILPTGSIVGFIFNPHFTLPDVATQSDDSDR
jgi:catechol 2,3-dioxygenase-like lactoylglutathione lyase family enzyme